ncbi:MAG: hypothetical protein U9N07_02895 [Euryarchaeota archaeon]|nr:hypothetical protein [Euryarchaeota archaeon]
MVLSGLVFGLLVRYAWLVGNGVGGDGDGDGMYMRILNVYLIW